ncbi:MAG: acyltransferase, partial [Ilumatobacteraceae bacterium]
MSGVDAGPVGPGLGFRPGLDGVRAVAVLAVIAYHLGAPWMRGGFLGVDLFMVLSGYLITGVLLLEVERDGGVSLRRFWSRRVRRILPAVLALLVALALYAWWFATPVERAGLRWDAIASLTSWANWRFIADGSGYWGQFGPPSPLTHMWSLAVEEQFYLVWPVVVAAVAAMVGAARRRRVLLWVAGVAAAGSAVAMVVLHDPAFVSRAYLGTDTRVQTLLVGAIGALVLQPGRHRPPLDARVVRWAGPVAAGAVVGALALADDRGAWMYRGGITAFALVALVAVVASGEQRGPLARGLGVRPLVWIGQRSY